MQNHKLTLASKGYFACNTCIQPVIVHEESRDPMEFFNLH